MSTTISPSLVDPSSASDTALITPSNNPIHQAKRRYQIQPGIWSDGALSTDLPLVQNCLEQARLLKRIPPTPCIVFVLAALHVYTSYTDVAHWLFWGPRFKHETAKTVDFVLNHRGVTIKSPVSWIGISENLFIIGAQQAAWRTKLTLVDWYKTLVTPPPAERRILRKRKAAPVSFDFDDGADLDLPNKKRPRTKRVVKPKPSSSSATTSEPSASNDVDATAVDLDDLQADEDTSTAVSSLGDQTSRPRTGKQPKAREESILSSLSSLSTTSSATTNHDQNNTKPNTRASSEASEGTAVSSTGGTLRRRRSFSGSSAGTAIGVAEAKDASVTTPDTDEIDLKSSRTKNNKRGRGRPKNK